MQAPPTGQSLALVSALSNPENHDLHVQAIEARDRALGDAQQYSYWCLQLAYILLGADDPTQLMARLPANELAYWKQTDLPSVARLEQDPSLWIPFGQMAGLLLKNAMCRPPMIQHQRLHVSPEIAAQLRPALLRALQCRNAALRAVASTVIATAAVSVDGVQPHLHVASGWPQLLDELIQAVQAHLQQQQQYQQQSSESIATSLAAEGAMMTIRKIMEDGPETLSAADLDHLIPVLIQCLHVNHLNLDNDVNSNIALAALQSLASCLSAGLLPSAWVAHFDEHLKGLSALAVSATHHAPIQQWICRNLVTVLEVRTEYLAPHMSTIAPFIMQMTARTTTNNNNTAATATSESDELVALEACDFWLTFASLDDSAVSGEMHDVVGALLPQLIPVLLHNMIYSPEKQRELMLEYEEVQNSSKYNNNDSVRPIFHRSKAAESHRSPHITSKTNYDDTYCDNDDDDDDDTGNEQDGEDPNDDDDDDNEWTLRKCAAASLDALANLFGGEVILPILLPVIEQGFAVQVHGGADPWKQEACILALGAVAEGCMEEMEPYLGRIHPYLLQLLSTQQQQPHETPPVVQCIAAWALGQYAGWAVEQVQSGDQGHLLAVMTEVLINKLPHPHPHVQVAAASALGVVAQAAGDLMAPYFEAIFTALMAALHQYSSSGNSLKSRLAVLDVLGVLADCCGPAIAEETLPTIYVPPLLQMWDHLAQRNPADRTLLPLMETLSSIAVTSGNNFQPYALECFENAMCIIEQVTLILTTTSASSDEDYNGYGTAAAAIWSDEDVDPIVCATDLLDGLVECLGANSAALVSSSSRYGNVFLNVLLGLCQHDVGAVRTSALALLGDLARHAPSVLEPALPQLLEQAVRCMETTSAQAAWEATNAVWAVGEICVHCQGHPTILEPIVPTLVQCLIGFLMGNGENLGDEDVMQTRASGMEYQRSGLRENAAACMGRLSKVSPKFVAADLPRFLTGWCDGLAKISDIAERRDSFQGFVLAVYANPQAITQAGSNVSATCVSILFAILSWHIPEEAIANRSLLISTEYPFTPFPSAEAELGVALVKLVHDVRVAVGEETWHLVQKGLPVNVRRLLRENYQL